MARALLLFGLVAMPLLLAACGGGGGGGGGTSSASSGEGVSDSGQAPAVPSNPVDSWLTVSAQIDLTALPGTATKFQIDATSSEAFAHDLNTAIIDTSGVLSPNIAATHGKDSRQNLAPITTTNPALVSGIHTGEFELRSCFDDVQVCSKPAKGSPWKIPYKITVLSQTELSYSRWEIASTAPWPSTVYGGNDYKVNAVTQAGDQAIVVSGNIYTEAMETTKSQDVGTTWAKVVTTHRPPLTLGFAVTSDKATVYLSGGRTFKGTTRVKPDGLYQNQIWKFDGIDWQMVTPITPFPVRVDHVMTKIGDTLFVSGGYFYSETDLGNGQFRSNAPVYYHDLWKSTDEGMNWSKVTDALPQELGNVQCALNWKNRVLIVGSEATASSDGGNWTVHQKFPSLYPLANARCAVSNGRVFVYSGFIQQQLLSSSNLESWQPERSGGWASISGITAIEGRLLVVGPGETYRTVP